ncbi:hypothetical protein AAC387_Pa03g2499 [Persea americana]
MQDPINRTITSIIDEILTIGSLIVAHRKISRCLLRNQPQTQTQTTSGRTIKMQLNPLSASPDDQTLTLEKKAADDFRVVDPTSLLSYSLLLRIFSLLPSSQYLPNSLVCKCWLALHGRLRHSLKLLDRHFLDSGSLTSRFPDLTEIDLVTASIHSQSPRSSSGIFLTLPPLHLS